MFGGAIFTIASAVAKDIQTLIICRFFAGMFGASQLSVVPGVLSDIYNNMHRGVAISLYALTVFVGPFSAPFIGGFIATSSLGWRWTLYIPAFMSFASVSLFALFLKETYAPVLLISKASAIRRETGSWGIHAKQEEIEVDFQALVQKYFTRPLQMLVTEPIILLIPLYMSFIYGIVYALVEAYPYVFEMVYGMSPGIAGLACIGLIIGQVLACSFILSQHSDYARKLVANHNVPVPEWRLIPATVGAPVFTIGIFWLVHQTLFHRGSQLCTNAEQVWLDGLYILHPLDRTNGRKHIHRLRRSVHLPSMLQLPGRLISTSVSSFLAVQSLRI